MRSGKVYLIGAGPGDLELLTLKAVSVIKKADVLLLDALVNQDILQFVPPSAEIVDVGKRGGIKSCAQPDIHDKLIAYAKEGKCVVRIKGGDPFIFGRGGEEQEALAAAGIEVEVVSGITSGIAVPATLGIPLTHRDYASGVIMITGHRQEDCVPNWKSLATSGMTLVIYMGITNHRQITQELLLAGMDPDTPAAAIQNGTLPAQRQIVASLGRLSDAIDENGLESPAVMVIGKVVAASPLYLDLLAATEKINTQRSQR